MIAATEQPASQLCTACFSGQYPIELPPDDRLGKFLLEQNELPLGATGGRSAVDRPERRRRHRAGPPVTGAQGTQVDLRHGRGRHRGR